MNVEDRRHLCSMFYNPTMVLNFGDRRPARRSCPYKNGKMVVLCRFVEPVGKIYNRLYLPMQSKTKTMVDTTIPPPLECSQQDYQELHNLASSIESYTDAVAELFECARNGETDSVRALIETWSRDQPDIANAKNSTGSTALHYAAANGHVSTCHLLLSAGALHVKNQSGGNTPLHWAAQNSHAQVIQLLLNHPPFRFQQTASSETRNTHLGIDVLEKNNFGRSALTEGFGSRNNVTNATLSDDTAGQHILPNNDEQHNDEEEDEHTQLIGMLLEHDSATEDRLIGGDTISPDEKASVEPGLEEDVVMDNSSSSAQDTMVAEVDDDAWANNSVHTTCSSITANASGPNRVGVTHEFDFGSLHNHTQQHTVLIRELPIQNADSPFGTTAAEDTTGLAIWCASLVAARWLLTLSTVHRRFDDKRVLELGSGCGCPGLTVALFSQARTVYLSDFNTATMKNLQYNIDLNSTRDAAIHQGKSWENRVVSLKMDWADPSTWPAQPVDCIIGSDLIYQVSIVPLLTQVIQGLLILGGSFFYTCPSDGRDGLDEFMTAMKTHDFTCVYEGVAPDEYRDNPLSTRDEEEAFLHFYELPVTEYMLFEFIKR